MLWRLKTIWRIVREVDLEAIRQTALTPVRVTVISDEVAEAQRVVTLLGGDGWASNPSLDAAWLNGKGGGTLSGTTGQRSRPIAEGEVEAIILVGREPGLSPALAATAHALDAAKAPFVTVVTGTRANQRLRPGRGESARVGVTMLDERATAWIAQALLAAVDPDLRLALGRRLPPLRPALFNVLIDETARANASYALSTGLAETVPGLNVPAVIGDIVILTKNQVIMSYRIALAAGKDGRPKDLVGEIAGVIGGAMLFRQIARELVGLVPVVGIVPKVAVAYGGTWAIGKAISIWATEGTRPDSRSFGHLFRRGLEVERDATEELTASQGGARTA
ncbi:MAG: hypothetical protein ACE148_10165 [Vicinamibacterales bacterium]